jgi:hypothetical protein
LRKEKLNLKRLKKELTKVKITSAKFYKQYSTESPAVSMTEITLIKKRLDNLNLKKKIY